MIPRLRRPSAGRALPGVWHNHQARRFAASFPRVYAFTLAMTSDEALSRDLAMTAFVETFTLGDATEQEFVIELFRQARELVRRLSVHRDRSAVALSARECEIISLMFDAKLSPDQVSLVLGITFDGVGAALLSGLRKLQAATVRAPESLAL